MSQHHFYYVSLPPLYRYENEEYIERFFQFGELKISSFHQYKLYADNQLGDKNEGSILGIGVASNMTTFSYTTIGHCAYSFCTSTMLKRSLLQTFSRNSVFRINNTLGFINSIKKVIPEAPRVYMGNCIYQQERSFRGKLPDFSMEDLNDDVEPDKTSFEKMKKVMVNPGLDQFFWKTMEYQDQAEFRIIFDTSVIEIKDSRIIECPEAVQFCERISV